MWAFINQTGSIELHDRLPKNWRNISNFFALESEVNTLRSFGWYPVLDQIGVYDPYTHVCGEIITVLDAKNNVVVRSASITPKSHEQLEEEHNQRKQAFLFDLRNRRDYLLASTDWTQAADIQLIKSDEWKQQWAEYRQWLRDLPNIYSQPPFELIVDSNQVEWRERPV